LITGTNPVQGSFMLSGSRTSSLSRKLPPAARQRSDSIGEFLVSLPVMRLGADWHNPLKSLARPA